MLLILATEEDEPVRTLSYYRHKLEAIERQIRKQFIEAKGDRHTGRGGSGSCESFLLQPFVLIMANSYYYVVVLLR